MSYLSILKIGGSVITEKGRESSARYDEMQRVSEEIAKTRKTDLVLVHGAGSFGHIPADKYDLNRTFNPKGILVTHNTVKELNRIFLDILSKEGLHVVPVHPMGCTVLANGRIKSMFTEGIELMLEKRTIPVLHGDVVFDEKVGVKILSGDQLVSYLARNMKVKAKSVGLGSNVDGILVEGEVVERITKATFEDIRDHLKGSDEIDVTGGMFGKVSELLKLAEDGISSCVFNAEIEGNVERFLRGDKVGSLIAPD